MHQHTNQRHNQKHIPTEHKVDTKIGWSQLIAAITAVAYAIIDARGRQKAAPITGVLAPKLPVATGRSARLVRAIRAVANVIVDLSICV